MSGEEDRLTVRFADLPVGTRNWVLARAAQLDVSPQQVLREALADAAAGDGFAPPVLQEERAAG